MKKTLSLFLLIFTSLAAANAQEEVLWEGTPANVFDGRSSSGTPFKEAGLQVGDVLRIYLTNMTESQKVWLKIDGGSVNSPDVMDEGTLYFDHTLTADNITKIENKNSTNANYTNGGIYIKFAQSSGQVYKITVRRKDTAENRFGLYLGDPVKDNMYFTSGNNLLTLQASEPAVNDTIVMQFTGAKTGDKMWLQNSEWGGSYGFPDVLPVDGEGAGEWRAVLTQAAVTDFTATGCIFHRSSEDYSIGTIYLHKYIKPEEEVLPPSREIILWQGSESAGSADLRYGAIRTVVDEANISGKDTIKVYVIGADAGDQVILKEAKTWDGKYFDLAVGQKIAKYPISDEYAAKIQEESFLVQRTEGNGYTMRYVTVAKYMAPPGYELLYEGDFYIDWANLVNYYTVSKDALSNLDVDDIIHAYGYPDTEHNQHRFCWNKTTTNGSAGAARLVDATYTVNNNSHFTLTITDDYLTTINENNLVISGYWYYLTKLYIEHPSRFTSVTMNSDGLSTFGHTTEAIDCSWFESLGLKAYTATISGDRIVTTKVTEAVPAGTGLILQGEPSTTYKLPFASGADAVVGNVLQPTTGDNVTGYVLAKDATLGIGFYKVTDKAVPAGKAYIADLGPAARYFAIDFLDDEATSIQNAPITKHTAAQEAYNFMGQRVAANSKGLVIINGKKVFNK